MTMDKGKPISFDGRAPFQGPGAAELEAQHREVLRRYVDLLAGCVAVRLTGTRDPEELYALHVRDCLTSVPLLPPPAPQGEAPRRVVDVGSGGGLPGLVWAVCRPDVEVVLLDSVGKKCRAVEDIAGTLGVSNVEVVHGRSEDLARARREGFDLACARAVASAGVTAELLSPLTRVGGTLLTFKGPKLPGELAETKGRWGRLGLRAPLVLSCGEAGDNRMPDGDEGSSRCLALWEKAAPCPRTYPRRPGMASMKGWWL